MMGLNLVGRPFFTRLKRETVFSHGFETILDVPFNIPMSSSHQAL